MNPMAREIEKMSTITITPTVVELDPTVEEPAPVDYITLNPDPSPVWGTP